MSIHYTFVGPKGPLPSTGTFLGTMMASSGTQARSSLFARIAVESSGHVGISINTTIWPSGRNPYRITYRVPKYSIRMERRRQRVGPTSARERLDLCVEL